MSNKKLIKSTSTARSRKFPPPLNLPSIPNEHNSSEQNSSMNDYSCSSSPCSHRSLPYVFRFFAVFFLSLECCNVFVDSSNVSTSSNLSTLTGFFIIVIGDAFPKVTKFEDLESIEVNFERKYRFLSLNFVILDNGKQRMYLINNGLIVFV